MLTFRTSIVGQSIEINHVLSQIEKVAQTDSTVLIIGESGTGKELVARAIHENSAYCNGPLVVVNCGAIPAELLEAELFGHVRGAFTGATQNRIGRFEAANNGTIVLDEVGDLPLALQVKLLRVLETLTFEPVGSSQSVTVKTRIIASTNVDLEDAVQKKLFREDLFYRLNVIPIRVPALRDRKTDIPELVSHFIASFNTATGHTIEVPVGEIMQAFMAYNWPGNVRELENLMERLVILKGQGTVDLADLPHRVFMAYSENQSTPSGASSIWDFPRMALPEEGLDLKNIVAAFENHLVDQALARTGGNKNRASELLRMNRTTLVEKLRKRGMIVPLKARMNVIEHPSMEYSE